MSNRIRGEAKGVIAGKTYVMVLDFNAMCDMEEATGRKVTDIFGALERSDVMIKDLRAISYAMLIDRQPQLSLRDVGRLMGEDNSGTMALCIKAFENAFPQSSEVSEAGGSGAGNPPIPGT